METFFVILGIVIYLIIGRILTNLGIKYNILDIDEDDEADKMMIMVFFPVVGIWIVICKIGDFISKLFIK